MKTVSVTLVPGEKYAQEVAAGNFKYLCDLTVGQGGSSKGPDPKDYLLGSLGTCTAMTIIMEAARRKWQIQSITVTVTRDEEPDPDTAGTARPRKRPVFTEQIDVKGPLSAAELADIKATAEKCPVYRDFTGSKRMVTNVALLP